MKLKSEIAERIGHFRQQLIIQPWIPVEDMPLIFTLFSKCLRFLLWIYINARKGKRMKRQSKKKQYVEERKKKEREYPEWSLARISLCFISFTWEFLNSASVGDCVYISRDYRLIITHPHDTIPDTTLASRRLDKQAGVNPWKAGEGKSFIGRVMVITQPHIFLPRTPTGL